MKIISYEGRVLPDGKGGSAFLPGERRRPILTGPASINRWGKAGHAGDTLADIGKRMHEADQVDLVNEAQTTARNKFADLDDEMRSPEFLESTSHRKFEEYFEDKAGDIWSGIKDELPATRTRIAAEKDFKYRKAMALVRVRSHARNIQIDRGKALISGVLLGGGFPEYA